MRYGADHKARTRDRVVREAAAAMRADGPDRVAVAGIMAAAGLTHGGFYAHFSSRDDLLVSAVGSMFDEALEKFSIDAAAPDPRDGLRRFVDRYLGPRHIGSRRDGCPIPILAGELHRLPDAARGVFANAVERMITGVATLLERSNVANARSRASSAVAELVGTVSLARVMSEPVQVEELLHDARASVLSKLLLSEG